MYPDELCYSNCWSENIFSACKDKIQRYLFFQIDNSLAIKNRGTYDENATISPSERAYLYMRAKKREFYYSHYKIENTVGL